MNKNTKRNRGLALVAVPLLLASLGGCASTFDAKVSRFQSQLPAPAGQTFAIVAENPRNQGGLEFSQYASLVGAQLQKVGYVPAASPENADLIVHFDYGVDQGRDRVRTTGVSAHPVGHYVEPEFIVDEVRVFVVRTNVAHVRQGPCQEAHRGDNSTGPPPSNTLCADSTGADDALVRFCPSADPAAP